MEVTINGEQFINKKRLQESMEINNELRDHIRALKQELDNKKVTIDWHHDMFCCPPREVFIGGIQYIRGIQCDFDLASIKQEAFKENKILRDKLKLKQEDIENVNSFCIRSYYKAPAICKAILSLLKDEVPEE